MHDQEDCVALDAPTHDSSPRWPASEIAPGIFQSGYPEPGEHWDAVIDMSRSGPPPLEGVAVYVHWRIDDGPPPERSVLIALADMVNDLRGAGKRVLVHCAEGVNRSGLLAAAALIREGTPPQEAVDTVRSRRPGALENQRFVRFLLEDL